jgi:hypothetical protein
MYPESQADFFLFRAAIKTYLGIDNKAFARTQERFRNCFDDYMDVLSVMLEKPCDDIIIDLTKDEQEIMINDIINDPLFKVN